MKKILLLLSLVLVSCTPTYKVKRAVVQLGLPTTGACSGTQIILPSGEEAILSAAHCAGIAGKGESIPVSSDGFRSIPRKILEISRSTDLMLLEPLPNTQGIKVAKGVSFGDHIRSFTHGARFRTYKAEGELIDRKVVKVVEKVISPDFTEEMCTASGSKYSVEEASFLFFTFKACMLAVDSHVTTLFPIVGGSSGGGVVNDKGELVGVVWAGDGTFSMILRLEEIKEFLAPY